MATSGDGAEAFYLLSKRLKSAAKGARTQFHKDIREAAKPLLPAVRRQALTRFGGAAGGLPKHMAKAKRYRTVAKTGLTTAGVSIRANKTDPRADTRGRIAHPIPGPDGEPLRDEKGRRRMAVQHFPNAVGFFSETIEERADLIRADMVRRLERWAIDNLSGDLGG
jgi:hypothetical protein